MNKRLRNFINVLLISSMSIGIWEVGKKQWKYYIDKKNYKVLQEEKDIFNDMQLYLSDKNFDWINISNTAVDYPIVRYTDNEYYTTHDYQGKESIGGAIYYDAFDDPFNGRLTTIFGHSMKNGTMFNNLHFFQKDHQRFENSKLKIDTKEGTRNYKPLGYYVTDNNKFYKKLDNSSIEETITSIEANCDYFIKGVSYTEESHILVLFTCDYSIDDGRLVVFYISE